MPIREEPLFATEQQRELRNAGKAFLTALAKAKGKTPRFESG